MFRIYNTDNQHFLRVARGEDLVEQVQNYCADNNIHAGWVEGLGACDKATLSFYNLAKQEYEKEELQEEFELLSLIGNISLVEGDPFLHAHATLGRKDKTVVGGHLHSMRISGTGEVFITEFEGEFTRSKDEATGLSLLDGEEIETQN